jgi:hypothetical protein
MSDMNDNNYLDVCDSHVVFSSTILEPQYERTYIVSNDKSCLRLPNCYIDTLFDDGSEPFYETVHFFDTSNSFDHISRLIIHIVENIFGPTALVAQVSYGETES